MYDNYGPLFDLVGRDSGIGPRFANAGSVVQFRWSDSQGTVTLNLRGPPMRGEIHMDYILGPMKPDVVFEPSGFSNRFLQGRVTILGQRLRIKSGQGEWPERPRGSSSRSSSIPHS